MNKCKYDLAWRGPCNKSTEYYVNSDFCQDHIYIKCSSCGGRSTHQCSETMQFVCGMPLCDNCEHEIAPDGTNGRTLRHCKKDEQKYEPWYMTEEW